MSTPCYHSPDITEIVLSARSTRTVRIAVKFAIFGAIVMYLCIGTVDEGKLTLTQLQCASGMKQLKASIANY